MADISFEIKGQLIEPDSMPDILDILYLKHIREKLENSTDAIRCRKHAAKPAIKVKGDSLETLRYEVTGCCEDLIEETRKKIK